MSCDILRDSPFEVTEWTPGEGYHDRAESVSVSLSFSHDPDRASVEKNFSFSADGETVRGVFLWEGRRVSFLPFARLEPNRDYTVAVSANAHDTK
ncbi:MAG: Ig-like domain-containing protein, partial [Treponema sp.]|nr:Ig-like domain-containing protein [Treponema sp.]